MSSEVQAKCTNAIRLAATPWCRRACREEVLDGLDVVVRGRSMALTGWASSRLNLSTISFSKSLSGDVERREFARRPARRRDAAASAPRPACDSGSARFAEVSAQRCRFAA